MASLPLDSLEEVEDAAWRELESAALGRNHPWRAPVLATVGSPMATDRGEGSAEAREPEVFADARCVILREVHRSARSVLFFTDARSAKVLQIERQPRGTLVCWSPVLSWQLRLTVRMTVATTGLAISSRWAHLKMTPAAADYLSPLPPGSAISQPHPAPERSTREHFAMVTAQVQRIDWLELRAQGHRRAIFDAGGPRWVVP